MKKRTIVVGIGVLTLAVAASPFLFDWVMQRDCDSVSTVARLNLVELCGAQHRYREAHGSFTSDLRALHPSFKLNTGYVIGFAQCSAGHACTTADPGVAEDLGFNRRLLSNVNGIPIEHPMFAHLAPSTGAGQTWFLAAAIGDSTDTNAFPLDDLDVWTVDEACTLKRLRNDCRE